MKRRSSIVPWKPRFLAVILLGFCFASFLLSQMRYGGTRTMPVRHHRKMPKIAFLFIARNRMPLDFVWDAFFKGAEDRFSIYVHSRPSFVFNEATTRSAFFYGRQVNNSVEVDWGGSSMIEAERILLGAALEDSYNARFVFLSDSFADTKEGRYNPRMNPVIPVQNWRKGSQWVVLIRKHAEVVVNDDTVFPVFQRHCKKRPLPEFWRDHPFPADAAKLHNCIPDEHYVQTLLAHINNIYFETEKRREWCASKGKPSHCFLFARKFTHPAALRLLNLSLLGLR